MRREHDEAMSEMRKRSDQTDELMCWLGELNRRGEIALQDLLTDMTDVRRRPEIPNSPAPGKRRRRRDGRPPRSGAR